MGVKHSGSEKIAKKSETVGKKNVHRDKLTVTLETTNRSMKILLRQVDSLEKARKGFIQLGNVDNATKFNIALDKAVSKLINLGISSEDMKESPEGKKESNDFDLMAIETPEEIASEVIEETLEVEEKPVAETKKPVA